MLSTRLNGLIKEKTMIEMCFVKLNEFIVNEVQGRRIIIVLNAEVVSGPTEKVGAPKNIAKASAAASSSAAAPPAAPKAAAPAARSTYAASSATKSNTSSAGVKGKYHPIDSLNPYQNRWTIRARITNKSDMRTYNNAKGPGKLFSIDLLDDAGGEIRGTFFNEGVDKYDALLQKDQIYSFSGGRIKLANKRFSSLNNDYEITFSERSEILKLSGAEAGGAFNTRFNFATLRDFETMGADTIVDVCGVISQADPVKDLMSKKGAQLYKRDLTVVDCSGPSGTAMSVRLTLWGENAQMADDTFMAGTLLAAKGMKIGEWGGRSLSAGRGCTLLFNPDLPEAHKLKAWYDDGGSSAAVTALTTGSSGGGGAGRITPFAERLNIAKIVEDGLGNKEKPDYITVKAMINFIKYDDERRYVVKPLFLAAVLAFNLLLLLGPGERTQQRR